MAYNYAIDNRRRHLYVGLSTDTKPTVVNPGTLAYEYDTGDTYITYDGTNWVIKLGSKAVAFGSDTITRPNDTTAYNANDVIGESPAAGFSLSSMSSIGGQAITIDSIELKTTMTTLPTGFGYLQVHLFSAAPANQADNAAFSIAAGEVASYLGSIKLTAFELIGGYVATRINDLRMIIKTGTSDTALYFKLETKTAFTPEAQTAFTLDVYARGG